MSAFLKIERKKERKKLGSFLFPQTFSFFLFSLEKRDFEEEMGNEISTVTEKIVIRAFTSEARIHTTRRKGKLIFAVGKGIRSCRDE